MWILDGLEVTVVGNIAGRLSEPGSGLPISSGQVTGIAAALYVAGACVGALFWGHLTDRYGRKKLFMITLIVYLAATALTAASFSTWWFFTFRFLTGFGIGGEYAAINSAIDELIPAYCRGRVDLIINGSFWVGAVGGSLLSIVALNTNIFAADVGWRLTFALGAVLALVILLVRRHVPESPRWLLIHGRDREADEVVSSIERRIEAEQGHELPPAEGEITIHQRKSVSFAEIARTIFHDYPKRATLGFSLFIGQAFLYNAITFGFGAILTKFFNVPTGNTGYYFAVIAVGNFLGPLLLGKLFDTVGRRVMISSTYLLSGCCCSARPGCSTGVVERGDVDGVLVCGAVLRFGGCVQCVSDGVGDLPHGDSGDVDRLLLRAGYGGGWDQWAVAVRGSHEHGEGRGTRCSRFRSGPG